MGVSSLLGQTCARSLLQAGLSPDLAHHAVTMLSLVLGLSPSDEEVGKVPPAPASLEGQKNAAKHHHFSGQWWEMWWVWGHTTLEPQH